VNAFSGGGSQRRDKACVVIQGPPEIGKTSCLVVALLAALDTAVSSCQAVVLTGSRKRDFEKYFNVFTLMHPATCVTFLPAKNDGGDGDKPPVLGPHGWQTPWLHDQSLEVDENMVQARKAHVLCGDPAQILRITGDASISMEHVRMLVIDDVGLLIDDAQNLKRDGSQLQIDDVIKICQTLELRSENRLRYVVLSEFLKEDAAKKTLRLLKNSLMRKKNLLSAGLTTTTMKAHKQVKHYLVQAKRHNWVKILRSLVSSLMFPRAIVYCDDHKVERIETYIREFRLNDVTVAVNISKSRRYDASAASATSRQKERPEESEQARRQDDARQDSESRRQAVQDFSSGRHQFLFTTSEPAVCQLVLPKVKAVFHFDVPSDMLSVYGVRLLPLEQSQATAETGVSILFVESSSKCSEIAKLFGISFMDMPFEYIPDHN